MAYFCTNCHEVYDHQVLLKQLKQKELGNFVISFCQCKGSIVEVDDLIFPAILELNKKGWKTSFSCSGHLHHSPKHTYTYFSFTKEYAPTTAPVDFIVEESKDEAKSRIIMTYFYDRNFKEKDYFERLTDIFNMNVKLYEWAKSLPYREQTDYDKNYNGRLVEDIK